MKTLLMLVTSLTLPQQEVEKKGFISAGLALGAYDNQMYIDQSNPRILAYTKGSITIGGEIWSLMLATSPRSVRSDDFCFENNFVRACKNGADDYFSSVNIGNLSDVTSSVGTHNTNRAQQ